MNIHKDDLRTDSAMSDQDWHPIATAPFSKLVLVADGNRVIPAYLTPAHVFGNPTPMWTAPGDAEAFTFSTPKYWRPLPAPPDQETDQ